MIELKKFKINKNMKNLFFNTIWEVEYLGNSIWQYAVFLAIFLILSLGFFLIKNFLFQKISRKIKGNKVFNLFLDIINKIRFPFYLYISFYIALSVIKVPDIIYDGLGLILLFWTSYRVIIIGNQFIDFFLTEYVKKKVALGGKAMMRALGNIAKGILWIFVGLIILSILGVNVTSLIAGMGIGGIAIAFALQGILSDLFSSFSIYFDKPFVEGDFIVVGDNWGTVEKIGIKSTRIRALQGEEIIISNRELTTVQIHNMRNMKQRRSSFKIGIIYETPTKKMKMIPGIIKKIIEKEDFAIIDRIHFIAFNDFSLDYEIVFFVDSPDYNIFMEVNERILLKIKEEFEKKGIEFAYPTKTINLTKNK
jgi:small-conductance mechanosensitive channel